MDSSKLKFGLRKPWIGNKEVKSSGFDKALGLEFLILEECEEV